MKKILFALLLALAVSGARYAAAEEGGKMMGKKMMNEKAPHMKAALRFLEEAKKHLEDAAHAFGGHREKAIAHVNEAIREVKEGMEYRMK